LLQSKKFKLYKIIGVPTIKNESFVWVENPHKFLLTSIDRQSYQLMDDTSDCITYRDDEALICDKPTQWLAASNPSCVWNIFNHISHAGCSFIQTAPEIFFSSLEANRFIYVIRNSLKITIFCRESIMHDSLEGEGLLSLSDHCSLHAGGIHLTTRITLNDNSSLLIPQLDLREWPQLPESMATGNISEFRHSTLKNITELQIKLNETQANFHLINPGEINLHDMHHYIVIYSIIVVLLAYFVYKKCNSNEGREIPPIPMPRLSIPSTTGTTS